MTCGDSSVIGPIMPEKKIRTRRVRGNARDENSATKRTELSSLLEDWAGCADRCVRDQPLRCVGLIFGVGLIASILPFGRILLGVIRPVLLVAGVIKVLEEVERRQRAG